MTDKIQYSLVLDLETSIKNRGEDAIGNNKAAPWHPDNRIVWVCSKVETRSMNARPMAGAALPINLEIVDHVSLLIGQNISFDIHYLKKEEVLPQSFWERINLWDTQLAEYVLTGQQTKFASLDYLSEKYGGTLKDDKIKVYWDSDIDTEDIPEEDIRPYVVNDVKNTELVFDRQIIEAQSQKQISLIQMLNDSLLATSEMEYNGMYFDKNLAEAAKKLAEIKLEWAKERLLTIAKKFFDQKYSFNPQSNRDISILLFGGEYNIVIDELMHDSDGNVVKYKSGPRKGQSKTKKSKQTLSTEGLRLPTRFTLPTTTPGIYSVEDAVLRGLETFVSERLSLPSSPALARYEWLSEVRTCIEQILLIRELSKDINTYYNGYSTLVWPDGMIHCNINNTATNTGRLSSSNPNLQNLTSSGD